MDEVGQRKADKVEEQRKDAYTEENFKAYSKLERVRWTGEQRGDYASEMRRLVDLAEFTGVAMEKMLKLAFVTSFIDHISVRLQRMPDIESRSAGEMIDKSRVLFQSDTHDLAVTATALTSGTKR